MFIHKEPTTIVLKEGLLTDKFDERVGHLNTILAHGGGNLNDSIFKSSNAGALLEEEGGGGMLKFRVDQRITREISRSRKEITKLTLRTLGLRRSDVPQPCEAHFPCWVRREELFGSCENRKQEQKAV